MLLVSAVPLSLVYEALSVCEGSFDELALSKAAYFGSLAVGKLQTALIIVTHAVLEGTYIRVAIRILIGAAILLIFMEVPFKGISIRLMKFSNAVPQPSLEFSFIPTSVVVDVSSFAFLFVVLPVALVASSISVDEYSSAIFLVGVSPDPTVVLT